MILESVIEYVVEQQWHRLETRDSGLKRELIPSTRSLSSHILIISGIRRCGKSTLLLQMMQQMEKESLLYLNFESPQLYDFSLQDFVRLDTIISRKKPKILFFDEIQLVTGWELYARQKLDEGYRLVITGSNASMLSTELGTKLTGRHITQELFPFSYTEYLAFNNGSADAASFSDYMKYGGFPEYLKSKDEDQLTELFRDILIRDIVNRYGIKDSKSLQRLASFLFANTGNRITATRLKQPLSIGATSTILNWFSYLEQAYMFFFVPRFSHSVRTQIINPRKVYSIDPGLTRAVSGTLTEDAGRNLENLVFLHLRRKYSELYYYEDKGECDFVAIKNGKPAELLQVCYELTPDNLDREVNSLLSAMKFFNQKKGSIITYNTTDRIEKEGYTITLLPAYVYLCDNKTENS
ncbi:MAG: ATP-binding protein [Bacteroidales bacterium]